MRVAFVTDTANANLTPDDTIAADYLRTKGFSVVAEIWDNRNVKWNQYDAAVLRSPWDYYHKPEAFKSWLIRMEEMKVRLFNPPSVILENMNKKYLLEMRQRIQIPALEFCARNSTIRLHDLMRRNHWKKVVVKPAVSAGAYKTWTTTIEEAPNHEHTFELMLNERDVIVQEFLPGIETEGELSLMFFNKNFSHCIQKKPAKGDFRIQSQFGGIHTSFKPTDTVIKKSQELLATFTEPLLYARVDGVLVNNDFYLMELELIEPVLFFNHYDRACDNFYQALLKI